MQLLKNALKDCGEGRTSLWVEHLEIYLVARCEEGKMA